MNYFERIYCLLVEMRRGPEDTKPVYSTDDKGDPIHVSGRRPETQHNRDELAAILKRQRIEKRKAKGTSDEEATAKSLKRTRRTSGQDIVPTAINLTTAQRKHYAAMGRTRTVSGEKTEPTPAVATRTQRATGGVK